MEVRVLGPLELAGPDGVVAVRARKQQRLLAALAIGVGDTQSVDTLFEAVWGERPPASARKLLQVYVWQLRKLLPAPAAIGTRGDGYVLELPDGSLDSARFERLIHEGKDMLRPAIRGSPPRDSRARSISGAARRSAAWATRRLRGGGRAAGRVGIVCLEEGFEAELALGRASAVRPTCAHSPVYIRCENDPVRSRCSRSIAADVNRKRSRCMRRRASIFATSSDSSQARRFATFRAGSLDTTPSSRHRLKIPRLSGGFPLRRTV